MPACKRVCEGRCLPCSKATRILWLPKESYFCQRFMKALLFFSFLISHLASIAQAPHRTQDLEREWLIYEEGRYGAYQEQSTAQAIHIPFSKNKGAGDYLVVHAANPVSIFINHTLLASGKKSDTLYIDSIRLQQNVLAFTLTIYSPKLSRETLSTYLITPSLIQALEVSAPQPPTFFRDFILVASFSVLMILLVIIRLNPKLASDYFSVTKIFSLRESEDSIVYTRITSSGNFLFFGFSSLTLGFFLVLLFVKLPQKEWIQVDSFQEAILYWLLFSAAITVLFFTKMLIIYLFATLFGLRDVAGMQFFNWVRVLFLWVGFSLSLIIVSILTWNESPGWFQFFYLALGWLLILWIVLAFFKIASKARIGLFHLFSYLCATEIIPSLIVLKILYY